MSVETASIVRTFVSRAQAAQVTIYVTNPLRRIEISAAGRSTCSSGTACASAPGRARAEDGATAETGRDRWRGHSEGSVSWEIDSANGRRRGKSAGPKQSGSVQSLRFSSGLQPLCEAVCDGANGGGSHRWTDAPPAPGRGDRAGSGTAVPPSRRRAFSPRSADPTHLRQHLR